MNIYQKINEVRKEIPYIRKDASVQGYKAVTHDQVTARLHDDLVRQGIIVVPSLVQSETVATTTSNGKPMTSYRGRFEVSLVNADKPDDRVTVVVEAHADDMSDKAPGKALSYAVKFALLKLFSLETGESDESRVADTRPIERITPEQVEALRSEIKDLGRSESQFCAYIGAKSLEDIQAGKGFEVAMKALQKARNTPAKGGKAA